MNLKINFIQTRATSAGDINPLNLLVSIIIILISPSNNGIVIVIIIIYYSYPVNKAGQYTRYGCILFICFI